MRVFHKYIFPQQIDCCCHHKLVAFQKVFLPMPENNFDFTSGLLGEKQNAVVVIGFYALFH